MASASGPVPAMHGAGPPAGDDDEVVFGERGPLRGGPDGDALGGGDVFLLGDVGQLVAAAEVGGGAERLRRPGQVQQVQPRDQQEDDLSHDLVRIAGWLAELAQLGAGRTAARRGGLAGDLRDRGDGREPPGERVLGPLDDRAGGQRARVREQLLDRLARWGVAVRDRVGGGRLGDERDLVAEVGCDPRRGLAALLGPDAADDDLGDALLGEQLLQVRRGERVVRGLGELGSPARGLSGSM